MKLSVKGLAITAAIFWGAALLIVGSANMMFPGYASGFLEVIGLWWEAGIRTTPTREDALRRCLAHFAKFSGVDEVRWR